MAVIIGSDDHGLVLKEQVLAHLLAKGHEVLNLAYEEGQDVVDVTLALVAHLRAHEGDLGIMIDAYGVASFMAASKVKGMIVAEVSDERTAYMTRGHNNARLMTMGAELVGQGLAKQMAEGFVTGTYDGGRHQIRVDMLNKMC